MPRPLSYAPSTAASASLACTHNFSSAPRLSLPTSFVNCTYLTRTHPSLSPLPSILPTSLPCCCGCAHYICTISNTVQQFARLFSIFFCIRPQKITSQIVDSSSPCPLLPRPSVLCAQPVCNFCKNKKENARNCWKLTWTEKLRAFHYAESYERAIMYLALKERQGRDKWGYGKSMVNVGDKLYIKFIIP